MCHAAVNWVLNELAQREDLKPAEKWLLIVLADHGSRDAWSFVHGHATIAKDAGMSKRTVVTMMARFEELGILRRSSRFRLDGSRSTDLNSLLGSENPALGAIQSAKTDADHVQIATPEGVKIAPHKEGNKPGKRTEDPDGSSTTRGTRLPEGWEPDPTIATLIGLDHDQASDQLDRFRDYWNSKPGKDGRKVDWTATWRNWCRTALERTNGRGSPATRYPTDADRAAERTATRIDPMLQGAQQALARPRRWTLGGSADRGQSDPPV